MQEVPVWSLGWEDLLEEGMVTHSSILAWRIPWTEFWWATAHGVAKSQTLLKQFSTHTRTHQYCNCCGAQRETTALWWNLLMGLNCLLPMFWHLVGHAGRAQGARSQELSELWWVSVIMPESQPAVKIYNLGEIKVKPGCVINALG